MDFVLKKLKIYLKLVNLTLLMKGKLPVTHQQIIYYILVIVLNQQDYIHIIKMLNRKI